jgi:hypothetical protein
MIYCDFLVECGAAKAGILHATGTLDPSHLSQIVKELL